MGKLQSFVAHLKTAVYCSQIHYRPRLPWSARRRAHRSGQERRLDLYRCWKANDRCEVDWSRNAEKETELDTNPIEGDSEESLDRSLTNQTSFLSHLSIVCSAGFRFPEGICDVILHTFKMLLTVAFVILFSCSKIYRVSNFYLWIFWISEQKFWLLFCSLCWPSTLVEQRTFEGPGGPGSISFKKKKSFYTWNGVLPQWFESPLEWEMALWDNKS